MDIMDALYGRRSIRNYLKKAVPREIIDQLLAAAVMAPSAMNMQPWAFAIIQDSAALKDYSDQAKNLCLQRMQGRPDPRDYLKLLADPEFNLFYNAGTLIIIYGDSGNPNATIDCCLAAQNLMLAAHAMELGTCWIGFSTTFFDSAELKKELLIPENYRAIAPIIVGYPQSPMTEYSREQPKVLAYVSEQ